MAKTARVQLNLSLPPEELAAWEKAAKEQHLSRIEFIRRAVAAYLAKEERAQ